MDYPQPLGTRIPTATRARLRHWLAAPLAMVTAFAVLLGALSVGVRLPGLGILRLLPGFGALDYARAPFGEIAPLREGYIRDVLGDVLPVGATAPESESDPPAYPSRQRASGRVLDEHPLTNDDRSDAREVSRVPFTARTDSASATREPDEWDDCNDPGATIWYRHAPQRTLRLIANTYGTHHAATLGVFEVVDGKRTENAWCNTNALGNALVPFLAQADSTYLFQVAAVRGAAQFFNLEFAGVTTSIAPQARQPRISADGNVIAYESFDPRSAHGFPSEPCLHPPKSPTTGSIAWTYAESQRTELPCEQVVVLDRRTGTTVVASVSSAGVAANSNVLDIALSGNGRFVAFSTFADNLVEPDDNILADIFVHDLVTRRTERASVSSDEEEMRRDDQVDEAYGIGVSDVLSAGDARLPSISYDGRYVVFESSASNLVADDRRGGVFGPAQDPFGGANVDVFVRDRIAGTTERVSVSSAGEPVDDTAVRQENEWRLENLRTEFAHPCISSNGRFVRFTSWAHQFSDIDSNDVPQTFVHDRTTGLTEMVSVTSSGDAGNDWSSSDHPDAVYNYNVGLGESSGYCVSDDGRFVVFHSWATNLDPDEQGWSSVLFIRDRVARRTSDIGWPGFPSVEETNDAFSGTPVGDGEPQVDRVGPSQESISPDGRYVTYRSFSEVTPGDEDTDASDVFVFDVRRGSSLRVSFDPSGLEWLGEAREPSASADGRFIVYRASDAMHLYERKDLG